MDTLQIWDTYHEDIQRFVYSKLKDKEKTNDIVQDVFTKVHLKKEQLKDKNKLKSWLFSIARNLVTDHFNQKKKEINDETVENSCIQEIEEITPKHTKKDCLRGIIANLPEKYREPLYLSDIEGIKQTIIAKKLELPISTVKSQIQRGRKMIIQGYMDCCDFKLNAEGKLVGELKEKSFCKVCNTTSDSIK